MKRILPVLLALCLLVTGCGGTATAPQPTAPPEPFTPHYGDYAARGMTATVQSGAAGLSAMGVLNNLYQSQAAEVYEVLAPTGFLKSYLKAPEDQPYVQVTFRLYSDQNGETYTVYENDLVVVHHPSAGKQVCTAPAGTYGRLTGHLAAVQKAQSAYFTLEFDVEGQNAYTLYRDGKKWLTRETDAQQAALDRVSETVVRVTDPEGTCFYDTATGRKTATYEGLTDLYGDRLAVADVQGVVLYTLFETRPAARVWVATAEDQTDLPVQGMAFSEDGKQLHLLCAVGESVYDRTFKVATLLKGKNRYLLGDWEAAGGYVTEDVAQSIGYRSLKLLRHKEAELGYTLSALPLYRYDLDGVTYYLTELGHWTGEGSGRTYETDAYLMVRRDLAAAYEAAPGEDELSWNTGKDWFEL